MKVIFLDVDGVLNYIGYKNSKTSNICLEKVELLSEICTKTNAKVVVISSWCGTKEYIPSIYNTLIKILKKYNISVVGKVPMTNYKEHYINSFNLEDLLNFKLENKENRAVKVQEYLNTHSIKNFVILDDCDYGWKYYGYKDKWIQPTFFNEHGGLQKEHVERAIKILNDRRDNNEL